MSTKRWLQIAAMVLAIGVLTTTLGARSIGSTVELTGRSMGVQIPESLELFAVGVMLVGLAASAQRVARRRLGTE